MEKNSTTTDAVPVFAGEDWFDPIELELRERVRQFLEEMVEEEATAALGRGRYQRGAARGYRNGTRRRRLLGSFGPVEIAVPRARLLAGDGTSREWQSAVLPRYARMTRQVEALPLRISPAPTPGGSNGLSGCCSRARLARMWSAGCGGKFRPTCMGLLMSRAEFRCSFSRRLYRRRQRIGNRRRFDCYESTAGQSAAQW
jgi:Transposase, Mutator family